MSTRFYRLLHVRSLTQSILNFCCLVLTSFNDRSEASVKRNRHERSGVGFDFIFERSITQSFLDAAKFQNHNSKRKRPPLVANEQCAHRSRIRILDLQRNSDQRVEALGNAREHDSFDNREIVLRDHLVRRQIF